MVSSEAGLLVLQLVVLVVVVVILLLQLLPPAPGCQLLHGRGSRLVLVVVMVVIR